MNILLTGGTGYIGSHTSEEGIHRFVAWYHNDFMLI